MAFICCTDDESYCIASCDPSTANISTEKKQRSLKGKVTSIVDDHGLIDHYIYFHFKSMFCSYVYILLISLLISK